MGHFAGQRPWLPLEDIVNKQSGVLVGELSIVCREEPDEFITIMDCIDFVLEF